MAKFPVIEVSIFEKSNKISILNLAVPEPYDDKRPYQFNVRDIIAEFKDRDSMRTFLAQIAGQIEAMLDKAYRQKEVISYFEEKD